MRAGAKPHQQILKHVVTDHFKPLGLRLNSSGRRLIADLGYWYIMIEFQPSGWASGTYLNVGCDWLFDERDYRAFTLCHREKGFVEFDGDESFETSIKALCVVAEDKMQHYRAALHDPLAAAAELVAAPDRIAHRLWAAACLFCLGGASDSARALLAEIMRSDHAHAARFHHPASDLLRAIGQGEHIAWLESCVDRSRVALKFPPLTAPAFAS